MSRALCRLLLVVGATVIAAGACSEGAREPAPLRACSDSCGPCEICTEGRCVALEDGAGCLDGQCHDGQCCTGCWTGSHCLAGSEAMSCGNAGALCEDCAASKSACIDKTCDLPCRFASVALARGTGYALRPNHHLYAWGQGELGQLGLGSTAQVATPTLVTSSERWRKLAAGATHVCALLTGGEIYCWGSNVQGQLGMGDAVQRNAPARLESEIAFAGVAADGQSTCAIDVEGALYCWGDNGAGQLGLGAAAPKSIPTPTRVGADGDWTAIALGSGYACGVRGAGALYCWGTNASSRLGIGSSDAALVQLAPKRVGTESDWATVSLGAQHACAVKVDGTLRCWGDNAHGQLGTGSRAATAAPVVIGTSRWRAVALGDAHSCGIDSLGSLFCWGVVASGTGASDQLKPTALASDARYVAVAARGKNTCAITDNGTLQCWGDNATGATGNSTKATVASPQSTCLTVAPSATGDAGVGDAARDAEVVVPVTCPTPADCSMPVCAGKSCGAHGQLCSDGACACPGGKTREAACGDQKDDDCDGLVDCADPDCATQPCGGAAYQRCCDNACVDTSTNAAHCQGCGLACASGQSCKRVTDESGTRGHCTCVGNANCPKNPGQICRDGNGDGQDGLCACDVVNEGNSGCASGQTCSNVAKANFCHY